MTTKHTKLFTGSNIIVNGLKNLLDVAQILLSQQRSLMNARTELSTLMGLLPGTEYKLIKTQD